jgi:hypothetical protein
VGVVVGGYEEREAAGAFTRIKIGNIYIYRVSQKDVYTRLIFRIIMCIHLFGILCIFEI